MVTRWQTHCVYDEREAGGFRHKRISARRLYSGTRRDYLRAVQAAGYDATPAWSPGGEALAFTQRTNDDSPSRLCTVAADGSSLQCNDGMQCSDSTWSPDGSRIACLSRSEILVLYQNNDEAIILLDVGYRSFGGLSWSPDGDLLVFSAGPWYHAANDLYLLELEK